MQPSDPTVDQDADPTRVRPDRQAPADGPEESDAAPTTVRPRFGSAAQVDPDAGNTDVAPRTTALWGEPARPDSRADASQAPPSEAAPSSGNTPWERHADGYGDGAEAQDDPDGAPTTVLTVAHDSERRHRRRDWAWVEEWRAERSAPAWGPGIAVGIFVALIVAVALIVLTSGVSDSPVLAIVFNVVIAAGMAPALWLCRALPVLRFLAAGAAAGILCGWIAMLTTF